MGYWIDMRKPYRTMDAEYVESVWWALKQIHGKGLLVAGLPGRAVLPPRETGLSDHEVAQGYETVTDPSVYVRFPLTSGPWAGDGAALLVWTTTPWTLVSNTAVAVRPDVTYVVATDGTETLVVAEPLVGHGAGRGLDGHRHGPGLGDGALDLPAAVRAGASSRRRGRRHRPAPRRAGRLRHHRGRHRAGAPVPRLRRGRHGGLPGLRAAGRRTRPVRRALRRRHPARRRTVLQARRRRPGPRPGVAGPDVPPRALRAQLSALLALPHRADVLRPAVVVHPHHRRSRTRCSARTRRPTGSRTRSSTVATATGSRTTSTGRCRAPATGARRCRSGSATRATRPASARAPSSPS